MREHKQAAREAFHAYIWEREEEEQKLRKTVHAYSHGALNTARERGVSIYQVIYDEMKSDRWPIQNPQQVRKILEAGA